MVKLGKMTGESKRLDFTIQLDQLLKETFTVSGLYVVEHPVASQGAIRMACTRFQSVWHNVAEKVRIVSKHAKSDDP